MKLRYVHSLVLALVFSFSLTQAKQIFLWDLDEVVLEKDKQSTAYQEALAMKQLFGGVLPDFIFHPKLVWEIVQLYQAGVGGEAIEQKAREYGAINLANTIHNVLTTKQPIAGMQEILHSLKKQNYKQYIGTNMGKSGFKMVTQKYDDLFANFEQPLNAKIHMFVDYTNLSTYHIHKPKKEYFDTWFAKMKAINNSFDPKNVIFIDDKQININGARAAGIGTAILFKDPDQLKQELQKLNISI